MSLWVREEEEEEEGRRSGGRLYARGKGGKGGV